MTWISRHHVENADSVVDFEGDGWSRYLKVAGKRAFLIGGSCETCAFVFERIDSHRLSPQVVSDALATGRDPFDPELIAALGGLLPTGDYTVADLTVTPFSVMPGDPEDYFSHESIDLFGMPSYGGVPDNPRISYWRAGATQLPVGAGQRWIQHGWAPRQSIPKRLFHFVTPMEPPAYLDRERVDYYRALLSAGGHPRAFGISVLDVRSPAVVPGDRADDPAYEYGEHWCLATYLLDGHHKVEAAARSGTSVGLLTFIARDASIASDADIDAVVALLGEVA